MPARSRGCTWTTTAMTGILIRYAHMGAPQTAPSTPGLQRFCLSMRLKRARQTGGAAATVRCSTTFLTSQTRTTGRPVRILRIISSFSTRLRLQSEQQSKRQEGKPQWEVPSCTVTLTRPFATTGACGKNGRSHSSREHGQIFSISMRITTRPSLRSWKARLPWCIRTRQLGGASDLCPWP